MNVEVPKDTIMYESRIDTYKYIIYVTYPLSTCEVNGAIVVRGTCVRAFEFRIASVYVYL